jgi:hypothetical protein
MDLVSVQVSEGFTSLDQQTKDIVNTLLQTRDTSKDIQIEMVAVAQLLNRVEKIVNENNKTGKEILSTIREIDRLEVWPQDWSSQLEKSTGSAGTNESHLRNLVDETILESLQYDRMTERVDKVEIAHQKTFDWIFRKSESDEIPWNSFVDWLTQGSGVYWINGKAGSGKSTLMRYIYEDSRTKDLLRIWAAPLSLTTATFFFWNIGSNLQKSQVGLLRSILYEVFDQHRGLIVNLLPKLWAKSYTSLVRSSTIHDRRDIWSLPVLMQLFRELIAQVKIPLKFCLFIDGLDEFDGLPGDIADLIQNVSRSANVKVCLSSRPLVVFETTFGMAPKLRLEDLTFDDIRQYAKDRLGENERFKQLIIQAPKKAPELIEEIVRKADGVFLWVMLVVKSLLAGLGNEDNISDLEKRLWHLPGELGDMYTHMLGQIEEIYQCRASKFFQLLRVVNLVDETISSAIEDPEMLTILGLALANDEDLELLDELKPMQWRDSIISQKCEKMATKLKASTSGLLEVQSYHYPARSRSVTPTLAVTESKRRVQYLHRTLREYLEQPDIWEIQLRRTSKLDFNPHLQMLRSYILQFKVLKVPTPFLVQTMSIALTHAHFADTGTKKPYVTLLDELDHTVTHIWETTPYEDGIINYWADGPILVKAVQYGLGTYVKHKLNPRDHRLAKKRSSMLEHKGRPLLDIAISPGLPDSKLPLSSRTIEALLQSGSKPNQKYQNVTPWERAIKVQFERHLAIPSHDHERARECALQGVAVFKIFLQYGAKPQVTCHTAKGIVSARTVVDETCARLAPEETAELNRQLEGTDDTGVKRWPIMRVFLVWKEDR